MQISTTELRHMAGAVDDMHHTAMRTFGEEVAELVEHLRGLLKQAGGNLVLPKDEAIAHIKKSIEKTYGKRGPEVVRRNCEVVDMALAHKIKDKADAAYRRGDLLAKRKELMQAWVDYLLVTAPSTSHPS